MLCRNEGWGVRSPGKSLRRWHLLRQDLRTSIKRPWTRMRSQPRDSRVPM
jgi:hypothetical protein